MRIDNILTILKNSHLNVTERTRIPNGTGDRLKLDNGSIINCYDSGKHHIQGANAAETTKIFDDHEENGKITQNGFCNKVFVVYGHDEKSKSELEAMLRRWKLEPMILDQLPSLGLTIIEKLEKSLGQSGFGVVLATPDDQGHKAGRSDEIMFRARQNVVLELGILLSKLGRERVAILIKEQEKMERPSDIQGLIYIPFKDDLQKEAGITLAKEMNAQGYNINLQDI